MDRIEAEIKAYEYQYEEEAKVWHEQHPSEHRDPDWEDLSEQDESYHDEYE